MKIHHPRLLRFWLLALAPTSPLWADATSWNAATAAWSTPANWSAGLPVPGMDFSINNGGTAQLFNTEASAALGTLGAGTGQSGTLQILTGGALTLTDELRVGDSGTGTLTLAGGVIQGTIGNIARGVGSVGSVTFSSGTWNNSAAFVIGNQGDGTFDQSGGLLTAASLDIGGQSGGSGTATLSGGQWNITGALAVGAGGDGTLTLSGTGVILADSSTIGRDANTTGTVIVNGGGWNITGALAIGQSGTGSLTITGGTVKASNTTLGFISGSSGTLNLNGGVLEAGQLSRGIGAGAFNWNGGTLRLTGDQSALFSGFSTSAIADVLIGGGAVIDTQDHTVTTVDNIRVTSTGGSLTKTGSGTFISYLNASAFSLNVNEGLFINRNALLLGSSSGRTLNVATNVGNNATFSMDGLGSSATPRLTAYSMNVGTATGATGVVELLTKGSIVLKNGFNIGQNGGTGSFLLDGATASFSADWGYLGANGGSGSLTLRNGTWTMTDTFGVGTSGGQGGLDMSGGTMNLIRLELGAGNPGSTGPGPGSAGTVTVTGGTMNVGVSGIVVGGWGQGDFTLGDTGVVANVGSLLLGGWVGFSGDKNGAGVGTATMTGGT